jgi:hypothetical protein
MLQQVLQEIKASGGPINLNELARRLNMERSALDGMIQFWIRKGRLKETDIYTDVPGDVCASGTCHCSGPQNCPFVMTLPRSYSIKLR